MLDPKVNAFDIMTRQAAGQVHFGAAVMRSAAGTVLPAAVVGDVNIEGIADFDPIAHDRSGQYNGFYKQYDNVPVITAGVARGWVVPNGSDIDIESGDYLEIADLGATPAGDHGIFEEAGSTDGTVRTDPTVARALEDVTMGAASYQTPDTTAIGDTTLTFTAAELVLLDVVAGDYILLEDLSDNVQVNRVKSIDSTTVLSLEVPCTVVLTSGDSDLVTKMYQCKMLLI